MAVADENNNRSCCWKAQCSDLESQLSMLYLQNESLSKRIDENHRELLQFGRNIQRLIDSKLVQSEKPQLPATCERNDDIFFTFPEEVWPYILVYITNSTDLRNLCDASPALDTILLHKDKPVWLFDQILPIIFKRFTQTDVLSCRLVCRKWNQATDAYLDGYHSPHAPYKVQNNMPVNRLISHFTPPVWESKLKPIDFDNSIDLSTFLADVKAYKQAKGKNPLINRSLKLGFDVNNVNEDINEFWESAINVLHFLGKNVWHVEIYNDGFEEEPASFYGIFQQVLSYLPKLKTLRLICDFENERFEQDDLVTRLGTWPLPCLPYLETLHVLHIMPSLMTASIISCYARQIRKFVVSVEIFLHLEAEHLRGFINLSELVIRNCVKNRLEFDVIFELLETLKAPNLEKLRLFRSYSRDEWITTGYLLGLVARRFPKLRVLDTYRIQVVEGSYAFNDLLMSISSVETGVSVYSIRTLRIQNDIKSFPFDFLLKLPNLEELCIRDDFDQRRLQLSDGVETKIYSTIDIGECLTQGKLYESNVWSLIPSLKMITFESFDEQSTVSGWYTREMYDYLKK